MKINLTDQVNLDALENISIVENEMQLSSENIQKKFRNKVAVERKSSIRRRITYTGLAACMILAVAVNWNGIYTFASELFIKSTVKVENATLTEEDMSPITINKPEVLDEYGTYLGTKYYNSLQECSELLGIKLLTSDLAWSKSYDQKIMMRYPTDGTNYVTIDDFLYIIGDLKEFVHQGVNGASYRTAGSEDQYATPVRLHIEFLITDTEKQTTGISDEYLSSAYQETYTTITGKEVQILRNNINEYIAYFYDNDIKYTLIGNVKLPELKRIVDSFQ